MPRVRGEVGQSGQFGYVAVAMKMTPEQREQIVDTVKGTLREHVLEFGHQELHTKSGEPYAQFAFVSSMHGKPHITDEIEGIAAKIVAAIAARIGHDVDMDPKIHAVTRSQPLLRERQPEPAEPQAPTAVSAPAQVATNGARAPRAPMPRPATVQAQARGADVAFEL